MIFWEFQFLIFKITTFVPCFFVHLHKCDAQTNETYLLYKWWKWKRAWLKLNIIESKRFSLLIEIQECTKCVWKFRWSYRVALARNRYIRYHSENEFQYQFAHWIGFLYFFLKFTCNGRCCWTMYEKYLHASKWPSSSRHSGMVIKEVAL